MLHSTRRIANAMRNTKFIPKGRLSFRQKFFGLSFLACTFGLVAVSYIPLKTVKIDLNSEATQAGMSTAFLISSTWTFLKVLKNRKMSWIIILTLFLLSFIFHCVAMARLYYAVMNPPVKRDIPKIGTNNNNNNQKFVCKNRKLLYRGFACGPMDKLDLSTYDPVTKSIILYESADYLAVAYLE